MSARKGLARSASLFRSLSRGAYRITAHCAVPSGSAPALPALLAPPCRAPSDHVSGASFSSLNGRGRGFLPAASASVLSLASLSYSSGSQHSQLCHFIPPSAAPFSSFHALRLISPLKGVSSPSPPSRTDLPQRGSRVSRLVALSLTEPSWPSGSSGRATPGCPDPWVSLAQGSVRVVPTLAQPRWQLMLGSAAASARTTPPNAANSFATKAGRKTKPKPYSSYKRRFKLRADGEFKRWRAGKRHNASTKSPKQRRQLRRPSVVAPGMAKALKRLNFHGAM